MTADPITALADTLMRAVVASGAIRRGDDRDIETAVLVMREEVKEFLAGDRYADERSLAQTGQHVLAMASLTATCVTRILAARA